MADDDAPPPIRLMNFVSEEQLAEARKNRGARVEDGTAQRDRPLFEILKENKDKKDAEFNERFKHRPPKALDEDETEFLDKLDMLTIDELSSKMGGKRKMCREIMSRRERERQIAEEEERYLRSFQEAVESQYNVVHELKETPSAPKDQNKTAVVGRKNPASRPLGMVIKVVPQPKRAKVESRDPEETARQPSICNDKEPQRVEKADAVAATCGLVSYSDDDSD